MEKNKLEKKLYSEYLLLNYKTRCKDKFDNISPGKLKDIKELINRFSERYCNNKTFIIPALIPGIFFIML